MSTSSATEAPTIAVSVKLTDAQHRWIQSAAHFIANETGCAVSESSIIRRMMDCGVTQFEKELSELRARTNEGRKRFGRLQLVYTRVEAGRHPIAPPKQ